MTVPPFCGSVHSTLRPGAPPRQCRSARPGGANATDALNRWCTRLHFMDDSTAPLASAIGARVRHERQARRWTLDQLAGAAGVSRRMVVNVEQGAANPSVGTLLRISDALGVGLPALVEPPDPTAVRVTRHGEGAA